jgi:hypothetical protein
MGSRAFLSLAVLGLLFSTSAVADDDPEDYNFFAQPGISREKSAADWDECRDLSSNVQPPQPGYAYSSSVAGAAAAGFVQGLIKGAQRRHMFDAALRKCMSVKGYQRYSMDKAEAKLLYGGGKWDAVRSRLIDRALAPVDPARSLNP